MVKERQYMAHQAKTGSTPTIRNKGRQDMTDRTPASKTQAQEVRKQFEDIFASLTASEADLLLYRFEDIYDWRTPRHLWKRLVFAPHDSDHAEWSPAITIKKGGAR